MAPHTPGTVGISPKVSVPVSVLVLIAMVVGIAAAVLHDATLAGIAAALVSAAGVTGYTGYRADPGDVLTTVGPASDALNADAFADAPIAEEDRPPDPSDSGRGPEGSPSAPL